MFTFSPNKNFVFIFLLSLTNFLLSVQGQSPYVGGEFNSPFPGNNNLVNYTVKIAVSPITNLSVLMINLAVVLTATQGPGPNILQSINLAVSEINSSPAFNKRMFIQTTLFDPLSNPSLAGNMTSAIVRQTNPSYTAVLGDWNVYSCIAIANAIKNGPSPLLQFSTVSTSFLDVFPQFYRLGPVDYAQVDAFVDYAFYYNITEVYIVYLNDIYYGPYLLNEAVSKCYDRGIKIVHSEPINFTSSTSFDQNSTNNLILNAFMNTDKAFTDIRISNNVSIPRLVFLFLPTSIYNPAGVSSTIPFINAISNSIPQLNWHLRSKQVTLILSTELSLALSASTGAGVSVSNLDLAIGVLPAVGVFKNDHSLTQAIPSSSFETRSFYDSVWHIAKTFRAMLLNGTDPTIPGKFAAAVSKVNSVGASGSVIIGADGNRIISRFQLIQLSTQFASTGYQAFGFWYPQQGFVPNDPTFRTDLFLQSGASASMINAQPTGMPAYVPGYWQWTPLPYSGIPPSRRFGFCIRLSSVNDQILVYSGTYSSAQSPTTDAYSFDLSTGFWSQLPVSGTTKPRNSFYPFCGMYDNSVSQSVPNALYTFGGVNSDGVKGELWSMTTDTFTWSAVPIQVKTAGAAVLSNTLSLDRAEGASIQIKDTVYILGGFHRTQDQEAILSIDLSLGSNAYFTSTTPFYSRYSFLQNNKDWMTSIATLPNGKSPVDPVSEMAAALNLDPNPILSSASWFDPVAKLFKTLILIVGGGLMPANTILIYIVEDNVISPFFTSPGAVVAPASSGNGAGYTAPWRDISLTQSGNYKDGYLYICDGWSDEKQQNYKDIWSLDLTCILDPSKSSSCGNWTYLASRSTETRDSYRPVLYGNDLILFGGWGNQFIHNDMWSFDTLSNQFTLVAPDYVSPTARELHSSALIGNLMIIFGGRNTVQVALDDLWQYDIDQGVWSLLSPTSAPPLARYGHSAVAINIAMYVFGGTDGLTSYSDLWFFSMATLGWQQIQASGPSARAFHVSVPFINPDSTSEIIVWGGQDANQNVLSEMWRYSVSLQLWYRVFSGPYSSYDLYTIRWNPENPSSSLAIKNSTTPGIVCPVSPYLRTPSLEPVVTSPVPYYPPGNGNSQCRCYPPKNVTQSGVIVVANFMYVIGGWDSAYNSVTDVCRIDISNFNYPDPSAGYGGPSTISYTIPPVYAATIPPSILAPTYIYASLENPANYNWDCTLATLPKSRNSLSVTANGDSIFVYGGTSYELMAPGLIVYSIKMNQWLVIPNTVTNIPRPRAGTGAIIYGNKFMVFGGSMAGLGTIRSATFLANEHWRFVLGPACPVNSSPKPLSLFNGSSVPNSQDCSFCTPGTFVVGSSCQSCSAGYYFDSSTNGCTPCAKTTYNPFKGATSSDYCLPCDSGSYNNLLGQAACIPCLSTQYCPAGSPTPQPASQKPSSIYTESFQSQATPLVSQAQIVSEDSNKILYAMVAALLTVALCYVLFHLIDKAFYFTPLDLLFNWSHVAHFDKPIFRRKTMMGGACTFGSIWLIIYLIISLSLPFFLDNDIEARSLVPNVSIPSTLTITANMWFNLTLYNYLQSCVDTTSPRIVDPLTKRVLYNCRREISVQLFNFGSPDGSNNPKNSWLLCSLTTAADNQTQLCSAYYYCPDCQLQQVTGNLTFSFAEKGTFASRIYWSINSTSGYPAQNSTLWGSLRSPDNQVFRGLNPPTIISAKLNPTRWQKPVVSNDYTVGYTQFFISQTPGSSILPKNFNSYQGVQVVFVFENQLSTLDVIVNQKLTPVQFLSQLLGSISGALAGLAFAMSLAEELEDVLLQFSSSRLRRLQGTHGRLDALYSQLAEYLADAEKIKRAADSGLDKTEKIEDLKGPVRISANISNKRTWKIPAELPYGQSNNANHNRTFSLQMPTKGSPSALNHFESKEPH